MLGLRGCPWAFSVAGVSLGWGAWASSRGDSSCGAQALDTLAAVVAAAQGLTCPTACGVFDQGLNPRPLHWQTASYQWTMFFLSWRKMFQSFLALFCCLLAKSCPALWDPMDCSSPGSSVHGIFQARILEWVAIAFSRGSSRPRDRLLVPCVGRQILLPLNHLGNAEVLCVSLFFLFHIIHSVVSAVLFICSVFLFM